MARERLNLRRRKFATCPGAGWWFALGLVLLFLGTPAGADTKSIEPANTGWHALPPGSGPGADSTIVGLAIGEAGSTAHPAQIVFQCRNAELEAFVSADSALLDRNDIRKVRPVRVRIDGNDWLPGMWTISPDGGALFAPDARGFGSLLVAAHRLELRLPPNAAGGEGKRLVFAVSGFGEVWRSLHAWCIDQGRTVVAPAREAQPELEPEPGWDYGLPEVISKVPPAYPDEARARNVQGTVVVGVLIDERGRVIDTKVIKSVPLLDAAAVAAVRLWLWKPAILHGHSVAVWATVPITFSIR